MTSFKKILVPLDGSKFSEKALLSAIKIVHAFNSQLLLIYVVETSPTLSFLDRKEYLEFLQKFATKTLQKASLLLSKKGINAKTFLKQGNVAAEINKVAKNEKCDLIIVGNKGLGSITRLLLGSVSNKLAQSSSCSLFIVK